MDSQIKPIVVKSYVRNKRQLDKQNSLPDADAALGLVLIGICTISLVVVFWKLAIAGLTFSAILLVVRQKLKDMKPLVRINI